MSAQTTFRISAHAAHIVTWRLTRHLLGGVGVAALMAGTAGFAMLPAAPARADTTWTGTAGSDWSNAANWSNGVPANTGNDAYVVGPVTPIINQAATTEQYTWIGSGSTDGSLSIVSGGTLTAGCCFYLGSNGTTGTLTVDGTGVLNAPSIFMVGGYSSTGYLTIQNGGTVNSGSSTVIGRWNGSSGYVTVTGENSLWSVSGALAIAGESTSSMSAYGSVTLSDSGILRSSGSIVIGNAANSTAFLNIGAKEGDGAAAAGSVDAGNVSLGNGDGTLVFNHTETDYTFAPLISGNGEVRQLAGITILSRSNSWSGSTVIEGGILRAGAAGALSANATYTVNGGTLDLNDLNLSMSALSGTGGTVDLGSAALAAGSGNTDTSFAGVIEGTGGFEKTGTGILTLTGANTYLGGTTVTGGTLKGNTTSLVGNILNNATLTFDQSADDTFSDNISGTGGLKKTGAGILTLTGANTHSGGTTVEAGTLRAGGASGFASGGYTLNGGTLDLNDFNLSMSALSGTGGAVDLGSAELEVDQDSDSIFGGIVSGLGSLVKMGTGALTLSGANTYEGGTTIDGGTLRLEHDSALGSGILAILGSTIDYDDGVDIANEIDLQANATLNADTGTATQSGNIGETDGSFGIVKTGSGALALTGTNSFTGGTTVEAGILRAGGASGFASGTYTVNGGTLDLNDFNLSMSALSGAGGEVDLGSAELEVDQDSDSIFGGIISGAGSLVKMGSGILALTGANTYAGGTTVSAGTLKGDTTSLVGNIVNNATLAFDQATDGIFSGAVSGAGSLEKTGAGALTLSGTNSFTGGTTVEAGILRAGGASGLATGAYTLNGGTLDLNDFTLTMSALSGTGGTVDLGSAELEVDQDSNSIFGGIVSGAGSLVKMGTGILTLTGANTYEGGTTVSAGTLKGDTTSLVGNILNNASLVFNQATAGIFSDIISGTGGLEKTGTGTLTLTAANTYEGGTTVSDGTLKGGTTSLVGDITMTDFGGLEFAQATDGEFTGAISGTGSIAKAGDGELLFTDADIEADEFDVRGTGAVIDGGTVDIANYLRIANSLESGETTDAGLTIRGGATVASGDGRIGDWDDFDAAVTVTGADTQWTIGALDNFTSFYVVGGGAASLMIEDGGTVEVTGNAYVYSVNDGPASTVTVTGAGSFLDVSGTLDIGGTGTGHVTVLNGGSIHSGGAEVGLQSPETGVVSIAGAGSQWVVDDNAFVLGGNDDFAPGAGHLTLADGGLLQIGSGGAGVLSAAIGDGSTARINIGGAADEDAAAAGTLDAGSIVFDADGNGDGALVFNHTGSDYEFGAALSGMGAISHLAGDTVLTGDSSFFSGLTSLTGGIFSVNGWLGGTIEVAGARLGGSGTVGSTTLNAGGILSPGNSIGALTVSGNLDFADGSFYEVEVNDGGTVAGTNNDFVDVTGAVTIDSGAALFVQPENGTDNGLTYNAGSLYTLISARDGISGAFGAIGTSFAFLLPSLSYDANNVFLTLDAVADFEDAATTHNQLELARALDALGSGDELYDEVLMMTEEEARTAFDALTGEAHASTTAAFFLGAQQVRETLLNRLASLFGGSGGLAGRNIDYAPAAGDLTPNAVTVWGQVFGGWGKTDGQGGTASLDRNSAGFLGGADREFGEASRIGIAAGYSRSTFDVNDRSSSGESDNFHLAGYAGTKLGDVELKGTLAYSYQMADAKRTVVVGAVTNNLTAGYNAHTVQASGEASMDFNAGSLTLTPFVGLSVIYVDTEGFTEKGGAAALTVSGSSNTTGVSALGLRARREWENVDLFGSLSWNHAFGDTNPSSQVAFASNPSATFATRGTPLSENTVGFGAGVEIGIGKESTLELSYRGEYGSDARDHGLKAELTFRF